MMDDIIDGAESCVNSPYFTKKSDPLDLSGMELAYTEAEKQKIRAEYLLLYPNPTKQELARIEVHLSDLPQVARHFALVAIDKAGRNMELSALTVRQAQILLGMSRDGVASAAKKFEEWPLALVEKGSRRRPNRYGILQKVCPAPQDKEKVMSCHSGQNSDQPLSCPTGQKVVVMSCPAGHNPIGLGGEGEGAAVVVREMATPNEGNGSDEQTPRPQTLESQNPDLSNRDLTRANPDSHASNANGVIVNCATIKGPGFVINLRAAEMEAALMGMPEERGRMIAEREAHSWATQGFAPSQPDKVVSAAIRKHVPQMASIKAQVEAASTVPEKVQVWSDRLSSSGKAPSTPSWVQEKIDRQNIAFDIIENMKSNKGVRND